MNALAGSWKQRLNEQQPLLISNAAFYLYLLYLIDYFLRIHARIPSLGVIRPTLLMAFLIILSLMFQWDKFKDRWQHPSVGRLNWLVIYVLLTLPFVAWPGSVLKNNFPEFIKAILFFYFTICIIDTPQRLKTLIAVFAGCQIIRVLEPLYLNITQDYWGSKTYLGAGEFAQRLAGGPYDVINGNELGFVIVTTIPFLHYLVLPRGLYGKITYALLMPLLLYTLILTMSRGAFLALLVVLFFIFMRSNRKTILIAIAVCAAVFAWSKMSDVQRERYLSLTGAEVRGAESAAGRVHGVGHELELAFEMPIFGHGVGTTPEAKFRKYGRTQAAHSFPAELIIEVGLVGLFIFAFFVRSAWCNIKSLTSSLVKDGSKENVWRRDLIYALQCLFWMYAFYSLNYWGLSQYYWYLFCGISVVVFHIWGANSNPSNQMVRAR